MADPNGPRRPRVRPSIVVAGVLVIAAAAIGIAIWREQDARDLGEGERGRVRRQNAVLRSYLERGRSGSLVPPDDAVISVREPFLQRVIDQSLPYRRTFGDGQYVARLDSAVVRLEPGLSSITLAGRGMLADQETSPLQADLLLHGLIAFTRADADSGTLEMSVMITDVRATRAPTGGGMFNPVVRYFARLRADDWNRNRQRIVLPIHIDSEIVLPEIAGQVSVPESRVPISVRISAVTTFDRHMAVSLALRPVAAEGARPAPAARDSNASARRLHAHDAAAPSIDAVERLAGQDPLWRAVVASDHDVVAVVPVAMLQAIVVRASRAYLRGVRVDMRPDATIAIDKKLRVKVLGGKLGLGRFHGTMRIDHVAGRVTIAGDPRVRLVPPDRLVMTAPLSVVTARSRVAIDVAWDPAFLVDLVCRAFRFDDTLEGEIVPFRHALTSTMRFAVRDSEVVCEPGVERDTFHLAADLSAESWSKVRDELVDQDRIGRCGIAMHADSILAKLRGLTAKGMKVRMRTKAFRPFRLPVTLTDLHSAAGHRIETRTYDPAIEVTPAYLRLGLRADMRVVYATEPRRVPTAGRLRGVGAGARDGTLDTMTRSPGAAPIVQ